VAIPQCRRILAWSWVNRWLMVADVREDHASLSQIRALEPAPGTPALPGGRPLVSRSQPRTARQALDPSTKCMIL
jgi:hypothetical protein